MQALIERLRPQSVRKTGTRQTLLLLPMLLPLCPMTHAHTPLERGSYLVNTVMAGAVCHTPRGPNGLLLDKGFSGGPIVKFTRLDTQSRKMGRTFRLRAE